MRKRYFWRRGFAYLIDLIAGAIVVTILAVIFNSAISYRILAPELIKGSVCEIRSDLISPDRMEELFPLEQGQNHRQVLCKQTNMLTTSFYITRLEKYWNDGNTNYNLGLSYYSDEGGEQRFYLASDPFFYLLAPLLFSYCLFRWGQTPGKRLLRLKVENNDGDHPTFISSLKREYFKALMFVLGAIFSFYNMYQLLNYDVDELAKQLQSLEPGLSQQNFWVIAPVAILVFVLIFWFIFGSFIRWRGRTFWDQFAGLTTTSANRSVVENETE